MPLSDDEKREILSRGIVWSEEMKKYKKDYEEFMWKCMHDKEVALTKGGTQWAYRALLNSICNEFEVVHSLLIAVEPEHAQMFMEVYAVMLGLHGVLVAGVLRQLILEEKEKLAAKEVDELEKML